MTDYRLGRCPHYINSSRTTKKISPVRLASVVVLVSVAAETRFSSRYQATDNVDLSQYVRLY